MATPLLTTKLYIPRARPDLVPRPRLIERLEEGLPRKLTLVSAPAGFGKTALVTQWLNRVGRPVTWLSLDEDDNDPARFLAYLVAALQAIDPDVGRTAQSLLGSPQLPPVDPLMTSLVNDVAATPAEFVLVLDDYHVIRTEWIHAAVQFLIAHQPPPMHLVLIARQDPPLPLPRLRVRGQVTEIRADDLRFTVDEATAFLNQALGLALDRELVAVLEARAEGWIAGLQLAALSMQGTTAGHMADFVAAFSGSHRHVIDYLADEVLARQPEGIRDFLRQTSILDRLSAPLCDAVTGRDDSEPLLRQLEQDNLFLVSLDDRRSWYRYHRLFADFLRTELDAEGGAALHRKAARWLAAHDLLPEAVKHALAGGDVDEAARVIALAAGPAFHDAALVSLSAWLDALPDERVRADGELATYKGFLLFLTGESSRATAYAEAAARSLPPDAPPPSRARLLSLQAHVALRDGDLEAVARWSRQALDGLGEPDAFFRDLTFNLLGQALEMQGDVAAAAAVYRDAVLARRRTGDQVGALVLLTNLAFTLNELGRRREAVAMCRQALEDGTQGQRRPGRGLPIAEGALLPWSLLSYEANHLEEAEGQVSRALDLSERARITDGILWGNYILARVRLAGGQLDGALGICRDTRARAARLDLDPFKEAWFAALEAQVGLHRGDVAAAARWAEAANLSPADAPHHWHELVYFTYVRLLLAQERFEEAQTLLATMERSAQQGGRDRKLITIALQQVLVEQALGRGKRALARVESALRLAAPEDYRRAFLDEGPAIADLLPPLRPVAPAFVDSLLESFRALRNSGRRPDRPSAPLIEPLTDRELEILRLIAAGRSNPEIAELLYLSLNTIKWHVKNLYAKLNVTNRIQAITRAQTHNLL